MEPTSPDHGADRNAVSQHPLAMQATPTAADRLMPWVVLVIGSVLSLASALWLRSHAADAAHAEFRRYADERLQRFRYDLDLSLQALRPLQMLFAASDRVDRREFKRFADDLLARQPALSAVGWITRVPDADRAAFEAAMRRDGLSDFVIRERDGASGYRTAARRDDYLAMQYIEPLGPNIALLGSDLGVVRHPSHALIRALAGEDLAVSRPANFADAFGKVPVILVFLRHVDPVHLEEAGASPVGVVMGAFNLPAMLANNDRAQPASLRRIRLRITDRELASDELYFFDSASVDEAPAQSSEPLYTTDHTISVGGRSWIVTASSPRSLWRAHASEPAFLAIGGLVASLSLSFFMRGRVSRRRAEQHVYSLTKDLRAANVSLAHSENRLRSLFDAAIDPLWDWDVPQNIDTISASWLELLGYDAPPADPSEVAWSARIHPDDKPAAWQALSACLAGSTDSYQATYRVRHQTRGWIHVTSRGRVVERDADGKPIRMIGNITDITAILDAKRAVEQSEELFRQIVGNIDSVFWMMSLEPRAFIYISPAFERIWARPVADFVQRRIAWIETIHPSDRVVAQSAFDDWLAGKGQYDVIYRIIRPGGAIRWIRDRGFAVPNDAGSVYRIAGFAEDVTARVQSEAALVESEQRLSGLFEQAAVGIAEVDLAGRFQFANQRICDILGFPQSALLGRSISHSAHPDDRAEQDRLALQMQADEITRFTSTSRFVRQDGSACWCDVAVSVVRDAEGHRKSFMLVMEDITARRAAEASAAESTERHRLALEAVDGIVFEYDVAAQRITRVSGIERILGYDPSELDDRVWTKFILDDDLPEVTRQFDSALLNDPSYSIEYRVRHKLGHIVHMLGRGVIVRDAQSRPVKVVGCSMNVSELISTRTALRTMEDRNRAILSAVPDHLFYVDRDGRYLGFHSNRPHELLVNPDRFLGSTIADVLPADLEAATSAALARLFDTGQPQLFESERLRDGHATFSEFRLVPASPNEALIVVRDITERKHAEISLRESEERYRVLFDAMPEPILVLLDGRIAIANPATARLFGVADATSLDRVRLVESMNDSERDLSEQHIRQTLLSGITSPIWRATIARPGSLPRVVELSASRISFGSRHAALLVARDLTDQIQSERLLSEVRDRLEKVLDRLPDIVAYDSSTERLFVGQNIARLTGHDADELMRSPASFRSLIHPDDKEHVAARMRHFFSLPAGSNQTLQFRVVRADGSEIWVEDRMVVMPPAAGKRRIVGVLIDVTQLKHTEFYLRGMMAERDHRVKNNLASVIAIANHMFRSSRDLTDYHTHLVARIRALANVHHTLAQSRWKNVEVLTMVQETLLPYDRVSAEHLPRVIIEGKHTVLPGRMGPPIALTLHELATNAAKHGALAGDRGQVHISWDLETGSDAPILHFRWQEIGGPTVATPERRGFGRDMIETGLQHELGATVRLQFLPTGLQCDITVPIIPEDPAYSRFSDAPPSLLKPASSSGPDSPDHPRDPRPTF